MQNQQIKNITLAIVILLIIGAIWYLDKDKVSPDSTVRGNSIAITDAEAASTTPLNSASSTSASTANTTANETPNGPTFASVKAADIAAGDQPAKEIIPGGGFINSAPFTLQSLVGKKVILLDFWTYSCINCQRTIPYLNAWYQKYKDEGLVIIGIHTPEFDFEKNLSNVTQAVKSLGIQYPVVQDNDDATWQTYENQYWPHEYLIDIDGYIVHDKIGEGGYADSENEIQQALTERAQVLNTGQTISTGIVNPSDAIAINPNDVASPETYFGAERNEYLGNGAQGMEGSQTLVLPTTLSLNNLYLDGTWNFLSQYAQNTSSTAKIVFQYNSKNVYFVASSDAGVKIIVKRDGQILTTNRGSDVAPDGTATIKDNRLYNLIAGDDYGQHTLEIDVQAPGLDAYTFTFG